MKYILMVIAPKGFKDEEYYLSKKIFEENEFSVTTTSTANIATSVAGKKEDVDFTIEEAVESDYNAIVFVGGPGTPVFFDDERALELAVSFNEVKKVVAAICLAPSILANAGILKNVSATVYESEKDNLKAKGANYKEEDVVVSRNIITANGPHATEEFANQILKALKENFI